MPHTSYPKDQKSEGQNEVMAPEMGASQISPWMTPAFAGGHDATNECAVATLGPRNYPRNLKPKKLSHPRTVSMLGGLWIIRHLQ